MLMARLTAGVQYRDSDPPPPHLKDRLCKLLFIYSMEEYVLPRRPAESTLQTLQPRSEQRRDAAAPQQGVIGSETGIDAGLIIAGA